MSHLEQSVARSRCPRPKRHGRSAGGLLAALSIAFTMCLAGAPAVGAQDSTSTTSRGSGGGSAGAVSGASATTVADASGAGGTEAAVTTVPTTTAATTDGTAAEPQTQQPEDAADVAVDETQQNNDRMLNLAIIGLLVVAALIAIATILFWRSTAPESERDDPEEGEHEASNDDRVDLDSDGWAEGAADPSAEVDASPVDSSPVDSSPVDPDAASREAAAGFAGAASAPLARSPRRRVTSSERSTPAPSVRQASMPPAPLVDPGPAAGATTGAGAAGVVASGVVATGAAAVAAGAGSRGGPQGPDGAGTAPAPGSFVVPSPDELAAQQAAAARIGASSEEPPETVQDDEIPDAGDDADTSGLGGQSTEDGLDFDSTEIAASIMEGEEWAPVPGSFKVPPPSALPTPPDRPFANVDAEQSGVAGGAVVAAPIAASLPRPEPEAVREDEPVDEAEMSIIAASLLESAELPAVVRRGPRKTTGPWGEGARIGQQPSEFPGLPMDPDEPSFSRGVRIVPAPGSAEDGDLADDPTGEADDDGSDTV